MTLQQIESWALSILSRVNNKQNVEDDRVELKAEWPTDHNKAARRIAGCCNAARGETVLWLIGADEKRGVIGAVGAEMSNWYPQVEKHFESLAPHVRVLKVPFEDKEVTALLFETDRAPYLVRNPLTGQGPGGTIELETPWREGTRVRSARRADLLRLLIPTALYPTMLPQEATFTVSNVKKEANENQRCWFSASIAIYLIPKLNSIHYIVQPLSNIDFEIVENTEPILNSFELCGIGTYENGQLFPTSWQNQNQSATITVGAHELIVNGPGFFFVELQGKVMIPPEEKDFDLKLSLYVTPAEKASPLIVSMKEVEPETEGQRRWELSSD